MEWRTTLGMGGDGGPAGEGTLAQGMGWVAFERALAAGLAPLISLANGPSSRSAPWAVWVATRSQPLGTPGLNGRSPIPLGDPLPARRRDPTSRG